MFALELVQFDNFRHNEFVWWILSSNGINLLYLLYLLILSKCQWLLVTNRFHINEKIVGCLTDFRESTKFGYLILSPFDVTGSLSVESVSCLLLNLNQWKWTCGRTSTYTFFSNSCDCLSSRRREVLVLERHHERLPRVLPRSFYRQGPPVKPSRRFSGHVNYLKVQVRYIMYKYMLVIRLDLDNVDIFNALN